MKTTALAVVLAAVAAFPAHALGVQGMPPQAEFGGQPLVLNGAATQKVLWAKLYTVGLYLEEPTRDAHEAVASEQTKLLRLKVLRNLSKRQVAAALRQGFARGAGSAFSTLEPRLGQLLAKLRDVRKSEELLLMYVPGRGTVMSDGKRVRVEIPGKDFADALFSIWLGPNTDAPHIRRALLGR
ncbi:MAG: chalcone isomerase family protein [Myxococcota bacterium]